MKNWKRFIAACLSVTMIASIPLTAFAESSVSVKELAPKASNESETQQETDLEKILSQENPYEYFSGLKDQEKLLDACKDEELFQLKEYMKYAYIHESDLKNRQSLDAYLLISKTWRDRKVTFEKEEQEQLLQFLNETKVYGTRYNTEDKEGENAEKTVQDFPSFMEYLQSIKKFDVPKYMELLSAFDEVKTEEDLANAKEAFSNFEEETFGFDEQETEPKKEDSKVEEQTAKEEKEDSKAEQSAKENPKEESKNADTSKKEAGSAKSATKIVEFVDVKENGHQPLQCHIISEKEKDSMSELLPKTVKVKMENGDILDIDVKWNVDVDPKTTNNTVYTYDIQLPKDYSISDPLQALMDMEQSRLPFVYIKIKEELEKEGHQRPFLREPVYVEPESDERAGTNANGYEFDYEIYDISNDGNKIVVKGWAYTPDANQYGKYQGQAGHSVAATKDYILNQHPEYQWGGYCLEVRNASGGVVGSYPLTPTERVDHTELWKGDSRNPTLIDVSFRFDIPLSDLVNKGDLYLNLHYIHPRVGDASFYLMYLAPSTSMTSGSYRVDFKADNISSFRTTGVQSYYNANPWKGGGAVTYNGNNLYYSTNDYFYLSNGTWVEGKRSLDSYKTTWFYTRTRYVGITQSDGWMHRTKADPNGSFYGWIPSSFIQYGCSNFRLNVSYSSYKLTLNPNGGVSKGNTSAFTLSPNVIIGYGNWWDISGYTPTRTGYTFNGWYNAPSGGTKVYYANGSCVPNTAYWDDLKRWIYRGNLTVYAQWTPNIAHITYNVQGGTVGNGYGTNQYGHVSHNGSVWFHDVAYGSNSDPYDASTFGLTKTGYHFGGWRIRSSGTVLNQSTSYGSTTYVDYSNSSLSTSNKSEVWCYLDAVWIPNTYTITYNGNGGTWNSTNTWSTSVTYGQPYVTESNFFTRPGYRFVGWNESSTGSSTSWTDWIGKPWTWATTKNVTLYAQWEPDAYTNYISHWLYGFNNEGTNGDKHAFQIGSTSFSAINGNTFTLGANNAVTPPHGCFVENYIGTSSVTGNWTGYEFGQSFTQKPASMGFQYNYSPYQYDITYNLDGGTNDSRNPSSYNVLYGKTLYEPTKSGYTFRGWKEELFRAKDAVIYSGASRNGETFTFTNNTSGNTFNASKVQVWTNDWSRYIAQPVSVGVGTHNNIVGTYTHTEPTGNYMITVAANGTTQDYNAPLKNVYLVKGKTYTFAIGSSSVSSNKVTIGNVSVKGDITGINAGKSVPNPVTMSFINNELPTRKIGDVKLTATWERTPYLDVNAVINGTEYFNISKDYFTFDVYINGKQDANDVVDYWTMWPLGTKYEIKDIKPASNVKYLGPTKGTSVSGTITETGGNIAVWLEFITIQTNTLHHKYWGMKNQEGNTYDKKAIITRTDTFKQDFGSKFAMDKNKIDPNMPKGFELYPEYYSQSDAKKFPVGTTVTQKDEDMVFYYDYTPIDYNIDYRLNGGINHANNPATYNILYGVTLKDPSRTGYNFTGWNKEMFLPKETDIAPGVSGAADYNIKDNEITFTQDMGYRFDRMRVRVIDEYGNEKEAAVFKKIKNGQTQHYEILYNHTLASGECTIYFDGAYGSGDYWESRGIGIKTNFVRSLVHHISCDVEFGGNYDYIRNISVQLMDDNVNKRVYTSSANNIYITNPNNAQYIEASDKVQISGAAYDGIRFKLLEGSLDPSDEEADWFIIDTLASQTIGTGGNRRLHYIHTAPTGDYTLYLEGRIAGTSNFEHYNGVGYTNIHFEQGKTYRISIVVALTSSSAFAQRLRVEDISLKDRSTLGVNPGKTVPQLSTDAIGQDFIYKELPTREIGDKGFVANWTPIKYTISYEGNGATGGSTPSSNHTYDKPQTLTPNGFHKDGYYFDSWNTKPDGTGTSYQDKEEVKNLTSKDGDTVTLHAQWKPVDYKITYKGNGSTGGTEKTHLYNQKDVEANGYAVKTNKGYTDFVRTNHTFMGWYQNSVVDTKAEMAKIYKQGSKLTYSQLLAIHAEQVKKGLVKETDPKVKDILLYAVWDEAPSIDTSNMKKSKFYEGVDVTRAELLAGITASDKIDGSLTSQIIITRIDYSAGKLVNGKKQAAYSQTWANGMPADAKLDTWFMQLDKNDSPVTHTVTYQVKDSAGNITTAKKTIQVVYNEFPVIKANDFRFKLKEAQDGKITKDALLTKAIASGLISASDIEDGDIKSKIELIDYDANAFKTMKQEGFIPITYRVQDSMGPGGKGKVTLKTVNVNIIIDQKAETVRYVRFINKKYYEKNANLDRAALAGKYDQIALLSVNGGLHPFSVWYTETDYRKLITETFEKTKGTTYVYTKEDIKKMREFVKQHGVGNAKEEDALSKFADIFMSGDYILK